MINYIIFIFLVFFVSYLIIIINELHFSFIYAVSPFSLCFIIFPCGLKYLSFCHVCVINVICLWHTFYTFM